MPSEYFKSLTTDAPQKGVIGTPIGNTGYGTSKYDAPVNYQDALYNLEDFRHNNQNNWDVLGNASMHFAGSALNAALEIPAIFYGALKVPFVQIDELTKGKSAKTAYVNGLSEIFDNEISRGVVDPINNWFQDTFKVYQSQAQKDSNFFSYENLASGHFLDALLSGAGYTAGSFLTGAALTKAFNLGKAASVGTKFKDAEAAVQAASKGINTISPNLKAQLTLGTIMATMESSLEARQTKDQILKTLKDRNDLSDAQKEEIANSGSLANFAFNMAVLAPTNTFIFKNLIRPGANDVEAGLKTVLKDGKLTEDAGSKYAKAFRKVKNPVTESIVTEGGQEYLQFASNAAIKDYLDNKYNGNNANIFESIGKALYDGLTTKEGLESTVIGGFIGGGAGTLGHFRNAKNDAERKKFQLDFANKMLPQLNEVMKNKLLETDRTLTYQQLADDNITNRDKFNYFNDRHSSIVSLVQQNLQAGTLGILIDRVNSLRNASAEELNQVFGNDITIADTQRWDSNDTITSLVKEINNIKKVNDAVLLNLPNPYDQKKDTAKYLTFKELQNLATHTASSLDNTNNRILKINADLNSFGVSFNNIYFNTLDKKGKEEYIEATNQEIKDTNPVHHKHLTESVNDIIKLNKRREIYTKAYNDLTSEKGIKENLEKIETKQNPPKPEVKVEEGKDVISDLEYSTFIDKGMVSESTLNSIANKVKNQQPLSDREKAIFTSKTKEINEIISKANVRNNLPKFSREQHIKNRQQELDNTVEELINTEEEIKNVQQSLDESLAQLNPKWNSYRGKGKPNKGTIISKVLESTNTLKDRLNSLEETKKQLEQIIKDIEQEIQFVKNNVQEEFSKEDISELYEIHQRTLDNVNEGISLINRLIFNVQGIIKRVSNIINKLISGFEKTYPNAPLVNDLKKVFEYIQQDKDQISNKYPEYQTFLQANPEYLKNLANFEKLLNSNFEELEISEKELENLKKSLNLNIKLSQELQDKIRYIENLLNTNEGNKIIKKIPVQPVQPITVVSTEIKPPVSPNPSQPPVVTDSFDITIEKQGVLGSKIKVKVNPQGIWEDEKGNTYTEENGYYEPGKTNINKGIKQVLYGENHFTRMWFQGYASNRGFSAKTKELINKIAKLPNWKDYVSIKVNKSQVNANLEEEQKNGQRTLFGNKEIKLQGRYDIDILLDITDPETGEVPEEGRNITGINNPNLFVDADGITINFKDPKWTLTEFNRVFSNYDEKLGSKPFTQSELDTFKANWDLLKKFNDDLVKWFSTQNLPEVPLPKGAVDFDLSGEVSWIPRDETPVDLDSTLFEGAFKDSPIVSEVSRTQSINGKDMTGIPFLSDQEYEFHKDNRFRKSFFVFAKLINGLGRWLPIQAKPIPSTDFLQNIKDIKARIDANPNITREQADLITNDINFWIASLPGDVIKFVHNDKAGNKMQLALGYGTGNKITNRTILPDITNWTEVDLINFINASIKNKIKEIDESSFRQSIDPTNASIDQFSIRVNPEVLKNYTLLFKFDPKILNQETIQKSTDVQSINLNTLYENWKNSKENMSADILNYNDIVKNLGKSKILEIKC